MKKRGDVVIGGVVWINAGNITSQIHSSRRTVAGWRFPISKRDIYLALVVSKDLGTRLMEASGKRKDDRGNWREGQQNWPIKTGQVFILSMSSLRLLSSLKIHSEIQHCESEATKHARQLLHRRLRVMKRTNDNEKGSMERLNIRRIKVWITWWMIMEEIRCMLAFGFWRGWPLMRAWVILPLEPRFGYLGHI